MDVPLRGEHYGSSDAHDWTTNSGRYYLREISVPDGYLIEQSVIPVEFTYENQFIAWQIVDCLHSDKQTTVEIDKRAFASDSDTTFALPGATLTVTDWNGNVVDSWESSDTAHVIRGLHLSHDFAGNRDTTKIYTLSETRPADGYTTARSIQFRLEQATGDNSYLQETTVWVLHESEDAEYQSGSIISPTAFSDDSVATIPAKLRAFWDKLLGKNPDADGVVIANWYCVNGMLVVNFTDAANDRAIAKCLRESDFSDLTFDKVYLTGAAAPAFFADKQVADKPTDAEITYSASWILLKDSDGFSQTVTMLDAPTRVKISKADTVCQRTPSSSSATAVRGFKNPKIFPKSLQAKAFPRPVCKLFQIHGSKFKPHPLRNAGQASHVGIAHRVFFFGICKDTLNRFLTFFVNALTQICFADSLYHIQILLPDVALD